MPGNQPTTTPCVVDLVSGPTAPGDIDEFELQHARRMLALLKGKLGRQGLLDLLSADIEEANAFMSGRVTASSGQLRPATTVLAIKGLTSSEFLQWLDRQFDNESVMLAAEPDHIVITPLPDASVKIVEVLGAHVCEIRLPIYEGAATWDDAIVAEVLPEADYPIRRIATLTLPDGTFIGRMCTQFGDTAEGFKRQPHGVLSRGVSSRRLRTSPTTPRRGIPQLDSRRGHRDVTLIC
ncbi:hypothetical protein [Candidatus Mycobacterium methanotrophicum]|uniref:Uncharacterized protein n=1 Tax=Candidatus Mycobacterium methanotrophicum TaxID=2943498 RepID=A0ABY4QK80_9MYCO|nr:hypothetical protein [Candidatus Mycobacterium methanotrophicum]UQX10991.1 hypothetical protein M5I08_24335 [Candidatus Mycobacterium methanotrophicum]